MLTTAGLLVVSGVLLSLVSLYLGFLFARRKASSTDLIQTKAENDFLKKEKENLLNEIRQQREKILSLTEALSRSEAQKEAGQKELEEQRKTIEEMGKKLKLEFENLAQKIFEEKAKTYKNQSEESLSVLLNPLKQKITDFQKQVSDYYDKEGRERHSLDTAVKNLTTAHQKTTEETAKLIQALKGSSKIQGDWGEMVLERLLKACGLQEGEDFILQGKGLKLQAEDGAHLKPDVVVRLPDSRHIVIDSKVSLASYQEYVKAQTEKEKLQHANAVEHSLRQHVKNLAGKSYFISDKLNTPDFTFLFVPLEGVFLVALNQDQKLFEEAWKQSIIIVTPTTLLAALKTVAAVWRLERQNKNVREIAKESGKMYDKFVGFLNNMKDLGKGLEVAKRSYENALNQLESGRGNLIRRAEKIKQLGADTTKELPSEFLSDSIDDKLQELDT